MLAEIEKSILARLTPVREILKTSGVLVRGLPDDPKGAVRDESGDVICYVKGGDFSLTYIQIQVLLPSRVKSQTGCFPILERILSLLYKFIPDGAISPLSKGRWDLKITGDRWLITLDYQVSTSIESLVLIEMDDTISEIRIESDSGAAPVDVITVKS